MNRGFLFAGPDDVTARTAIQYGCIVGARSRAADDQVFATIAADQAASGNIDGIDDFQVTGLFRLDAFVGVFVFFKREVVGGALYFFRNGRFGHRQAQLAVFPVAQVDLSGTRFVLDDERGVFSLSE